MRLTGKTAIVTGAGRGIGFAGAAAFASEGANVVIAEIDQELGKHAAGKLRATGGEATFVATDCANTAEVKTLMVRTKELYGGLHILYNNAAVFLPDDDGAVTELSEETWEWILRMNLRSVFLCCKYGIPLMIESGGGAVINTGSSASVIGIRGCDAYTAAKGATVSMTRSMAVEFGPSGIRVNCICPAGVETEMMQASSLDNPDFDSDRFLSQAPLGRFGVPAEIGSLAVFLASDQSSYINGAIIRADGGITIASIA